MSRKEFHRLIPLLIFVFLALTAQAQEELVVLHTNDLHGQSLAALATLIEEERAQNPHLLLVDAGDLFSGTAVSNLFQGQAEQEAVLALGYDALALGNHDFDFGQEVLQKSLAQGVPWLSANVFAGTKTLVPPFLIKEVGGVKVLLIGLTTTATPAMALSRNVAGLYFANPQKTLERILQEQVGQYHLCLVLSHLGYSEDLLLAQRVPGITAIIGGHSHTVLNPARRLGGTLVAQTGSSAQYLGKIVISLEEGFPAEGSLLRVEPSTAKHPLITRIDAHYASLMAAEMGVVVGYATRDYVTRGLGHLLVQALLHFSGADAALYNGGGVRAGLKAGPVTKEDLFAVEPFDNRAVLVTLPGEAMAELIKLKSTRSGDFFEGPRLVDLGREYTVATSDFLTSKSSGYGILSQEGRITDLGRPVREVLEIYLREFILDSPPQAESF